MMDGERCTEVKVEGQPRYPFGAIGGVRAKNEVTAWLVSKAFSPPAKSGSHAKRAAGELCQEALTGPQSRAGGKGCNGAKACRWLLVIRSQLISLTSSLFVVILDVLNLLENQGCLSN